MLPVEALGREEAQRLRGLLFDLDDTLLDDGRLSLAAHQALEALAGAGLALLAVTGRPAGWGAVLSRLWPVRGVVTENGAVILYRQGRTVRLLDPVDPAERAARRERLEVLAGDLQARFPELTRVQECSVRMSDLALDIGEARNVSSDVVQQAMQLARARGFYAVRSTVHLHLTLDDEDKASGALRALEALCEEEPAMARGRYGFIGDSDNDAPCFAAFSTTFAVSNFRALATVQPRYVTRAARGAGFAEAARVILERRAPV
jgi:hydroxymethylpyrimidine pyrophosphatase-like HAD family hydrolase